MRLGTLAVPIGAVPALLAHPAHSRTE